MKSTLQAILMTSSNHKRDERHEKGRSGLGGVAAVHELELLGESIGDVAEIDLVN